jgi:aspartate aminotransferase
VTGRLSPLQQRLNWVETHPGREWVLALENVPQWDTWPVLPTAPPDPLVWTYSNSRGTHELITRVCERERATGRIVESASVLITHGAMFALGVIFRHLNALGFRTLLCQAPVLGSIHELASASGLRPTLTSVEDMIQVLDGPLEGATVAVYVNTPHNPTGSVLDQALVDALVTRVGQRNVALVVDSVYDGFNFSPDAAPRFPVGTPGVFLVNSMSKNYGAPGLRVGWILADPRSVAELTARLEYETIAVSGVSQHLAAELIRHGNGPLVDRVSGGRRLIVDWWAGFDDDRPVVAEGGTQAWVPVPDSAADSDFTDLLMHAFGLVLVGSESYAGVTGSYVRVPLGCPVDHLRHVLDVLEKSFARAAVSVGRSDIR